VGGHVGVGCVADAVEYWRDTRLVVEDERAMRYSWRVSTSEQPNAMDDGFAEFGPQNLVATVVLVGISGDTWHHNEGCVKVKQLHVERMAVRSKT
jgi:hypothetical protein